MPFMAYKISKTEFNSVMETSNAREVKEAVDIINTVVEMVREERLEISESSFELEDGECEFDFTLGPEKGYKHDKQQRIAFEAAELVKSHPGYNCCFSYDTQVEEVDDEEEDEE